MGRSVLLALICILNRPGYFLRVATCLIVEAHKTLNVPSSTMNDIKGKIQFLASQL